MSDTTLSTAQVAKRYRVGIHKILTLIARGEIDAVNVSLSGRRPQWRIPPEAIEAFERRRSAQPKTLARRKTKHQYRYF